MKNQLITAFGLLLAAGSMSADITVNFKQLPPEGKVVVTRLGIDDTNKPRAERRKLTFTDTVTVANNKIDLKSPAVPSAYTLAFGEDDINFFAAPGENIKIEVNSINPFSYSMSGTQLVEGMQVLFDKSMPIEQEFMTLRNQGNPDKQALQNLIDAYGMVFTDFISANPDNVAVPYAVMNLEGDEMINAFNAMSDAAKTSIVMPLAQAQYDRTVKSLEEQRKRDALQSGDVEAPVFKLKDLNGKEVSLSDFRGKWVIIDFWGTWCPWCIKGFPALKEAYKKYAGELEIIGVDCGESEEQWRAGVERYELPWVQVYKPESDSKVLQDYYVEGFPTKVIVNPEGKIANITVGEDPEFFNILAALIGR